MEAVCIVRTVAAVSHRSSVRHPAGNGNIISVRHIIPKAGVSCSKAHLIEEEDLMEDVLTYIKLCRNALCEVIATYDLKDFESEKENGRGKNDRNCIEKSVTERIS